MNLCAPALIYVAFSLTQIVIDTFNGLYNTAFVKSIVAIIITILLNTLCKNGMGVVSWIIVFIPFVFMTLIIAILLNVFGLNPSTGRINIVKNGNVVYSTKKLNNNSVKYVDVSYSEAPLDDTSDPQYQ